MKTLSMQRPLPSIEIRMSQVAEHGLVEQLVAHPTVETFDETVLHRFAWRDVVPFDLVLGTPSQDGVTGHSVPLSLTTMPGFPRRSIRAVSSRATRHPEIEGEPSRRHRFKADGERDCRETFTGDIVDHVEPPEALAVGELVVDEPKVCEAKSSDQRALGRASTRIEARVPTALRRAFRLRTVSPSAR